MIEISDVSEVVNTLRGNPLRTLLTAASIFWGIFILIVMLGFGSGIEDGVNKTMSGYAQNSLYLWSSKTSVAWQGLTPGRGINLNNSDTAAIRMLPEVGLVAPRVRLGRWSGRVDVVYGARVTDGLIMGDTPEFSHILPMKIEIGRFINPLDIENRRKVAVIGEQVYIDLFGPGVNPVGETITINQISFTVAGVFKPVRYGDDKERLMATVFTPLSTFQQVFNYGQQVGYYALLPAKGVLSEVAGVQVRELLKKRHRVAPTDNRAFGSWNSEKEFLRLRNLFTGVRAFIWTVGIATLLAGVLSVSNIMLIAIRERRREFGIRKALGATPASVVKMILLETTVLVGIAGLLGLLAGLMTLRVIDVFTRAHTQDGGGSVLFSTPTVDIGVALMALAALAVAALIASIIPAWRATHIDPVEALRAE